MSTHSEYILEILRKKIFIQQWINGKYKEKPLIIYGNTGIGKTSLANYILRDFIKIDVNIDFCKTNKTLDTFLDLSLYKKSITMMFERLKSKALLIDDLKYIQENDKTLFKQVLDFSKRKVTHPVIYIVNNISHKLVQTIYKKAFPIHISFTEKQYISILKEFYVKDTTINYSELIQKSNYNFHNIQMNLKFYQGKTDTIQTFQKNEEELFTLIQKVYRMDSLEDIYRSIINDHTIISLNILQNCIDWIYNSKLSYQDMVYLIHNIFLSYCIGDTFNHQLQKLYDWDLMNYMITSTTVFPLRYLSYYKITMKDMVYNKYLSRSIIYTYNNKLLYLNRLNIDILSCLYSLILNKKYKDARYICSYYKIDIKLCEKFGKYFLSNHKKEVQKIFKNISTK